MLKPGNTAGEATITVRQEENDFYEPASFSHTFIVVRREDNNNGAMLIKDANEWKSFCKLVNEKGHIYLDAKLDANINLGSDITMVGADGHKYAGTFDGQDHTLTLNWNDGATTDIAPFKKVDGATIRNLRVTGGINSSKEDGKLAGLIVESNGNTTITITNCVTDMRLQVKTEGIGGMVYEAGKGSLTMTNCVTNGMIINDKGGAGGMICSIYRARNSKLRCKYS